MQWFLKKRHLSLLLLAVLLNACVSYPTTQQMLDDTRDFQLPVLPAKGFGLVCVVRPSDIGGWVRFNVFLDSKEDAFEVGYTRGEQYLCFNVTPGKHRLYSKAETWDDLDVTLGESDVVFVQQEPASGFFLPRNLLLPVKDYKGKYYLKRSSPGTLIHRSTGSQ